MQNLSLNIFDYFLLIIVVVSMIFGFCRGFTKEIISLIAWVLAFAVAVLFTPHLALFLNHYINNFTAAKVLSFIALFVVILVLGAIVNLIIASSSEVKTGLINRPLGALFGVGRGVIIAALIVLLLANTAVKKQLWFEHSQAVQQVEKASQTKAAQKVKQYGEQKVQAVNN